MNSVEDRKDDEHEDEKKGGRAQGEAAAPAPLIS